MVAVVLAITVGMLFACGTFMILRRGQIKLIMGLGLLSHAVNLLLFGSGTLTRGEPPIFVDKKAWADQLQQTGLADPLPQALILTAIVISFGITAFVIVLVNRRHTLSNTDTVQGEYVRLLREGDPFDLSGVQSEAGAATRTTGHDWLAYELDEVYDRDDMPRGWTPPESSEEDESSALEEEDI